LQKTRKRRWLSISAALLWVGLILPNARAQTVSASPLDLTKVREQADALKGKGRWFEACGLYDELLSRDRSNASLRESYRYCLRHFRQTRRLEDGSLQATLGRLTAARSLDLYDEVLRAVTENYVERERIDLAGLFRQGLEELRFALEEKTFLQKFLTQGSLPSLETFKARLSQWKSRKVPDLGRARRLLREVVQLGSQAGIMPGFIALECACGACNSLDEYSLYLAPRRFSHARTALRQKFVGIGLELVVADGKFEVGRVYRKSPAAVAGLTRGDRVTRIDGRKLDALAPDIAIERLLGETGTFVELEVIPRGATLAQAVKIERQEVLPNSVDHEKLEKPGEMGSYVGYIRIHYFQESTLQEVKAALAEWAGLPLKGVILDLRGNPGGLFKSSLSVAEIFLPETVIAHTHSPLRDFNRTYRSNNGTPFVLPLVVLIDGETASAAEVLAGALKDNRAATLVGSPTYGKGSIQCVIPLEQAPGGLRLTVARFSSPSRVPFAGRGILPDVPVSAGDGDMALQLADDILRRMNMMPR
jgi:carboxyl-terminal processing protease